MGKVCLNFKIIYGTADLHKPQRNSTDANFISNAHGLHRGTHCNVIYTSVYMQTAA